MQNPATKNVLASVLTQATPSLVELHTKERVHRSQTYAEIVAFVEGLRSQLRDRDIRCPPHSALWLLLLKASALNEQWEAQTHGQDIHTLMQADEALRIAQAIVEVIDEPGAAEAIRRMTKSDMNLSMRIPLMADSDSIPIADSVPGDGGHVARVS